MPDENERSNDTLRSEDPAMSLEGHGLEALGLRTNSDHVEIGEEQGAMILLVLGPTRRAAIAVASFSRSLS